jgi:alpha-mannosidase
VVKFSSGLASKGTFYTDSNGREMLKRQRDARGPSYPPFVINEPVAENYYPVNSMISLDDGKVEMTVVTDVTMGGASMQDGELEVMVHRRVQKDDSRGVQEPMNETMCGCNDIGAKPGSMGEFGHEGDGGCDCEGLTMRGSAYIVLDTLQNAHATRRQLVETLNFPPTLAFTKASTVATPSMSAIAAQLPANVKLMTISSNYKAWNEGKLILRLSHMYAVGEHATLSQPATIDLAKTFAKTGLKLTSISETLLTANQGKDQWEKKKKVWPTQQMYENTNLAEAQTERVPLREGDMSITINAMELKTYLVEFA